MSMTIYRKTPEMQTCCILFCVASVSAIAIATLSLFTHYGVNLKALNCLSNIPRPASFALGGIGLLSFPFAVSWGIRMVRGKNEDSGESNAYVMTRERATREMQRLCEEVMAQILDKQGSLDVSRRQTQITFTATGHPPIKLQASYTLNSVGDIARICLTGKRGTAFSCDPQRIGSVVDDFEQRDQFMKLVTGNEEATLNLSA